MRTTAVATTMPPLTKGTNWKDKKQVLAAVAADGWDIFFAPTLQNDRDVVLAAVKQDGSTLQFASPELKLDPAVVRAAVTNKPSAMYCELAPLCRPRPSVPPPLARYMHHLADSSCTTPRELAAAHIANLLIPPFTLLLKDLLKE